MPRRADRLPAAGALIPGSAPSVPARGGPGPAPGSPAPPGRADPRPRATPRPWLSTRATRARHPSARSAARALVSGVRPRAALRPEAPHCSSEEAAERRWGGPGAAAALPRRAGATSWPQPRCAPCPGPCGAGTPRTRFGDRRAGVPAPSPEPSYFPGRHQPRGPKAALAPAEHRRDAHPAETLLFCQVPPRASSPAASHRSDFAWQHTPIFCPSLIRNSRGSSLLTDLSINSACGVGPAHRARRRDVLSSSPRSSTSQWAIKCARLRVSTMIVTRSSPRPLATLKHVGAHVIS